MKLMQLNALRVIILLLPFSFSAQSKAYKKDQKRIWTEANFFYEAEDYEMALTLYANIYLVDEEYDEINFRIGKCYFNIPGEKKKSIPYFQKAKSTGYTEAYFWLGRAYHIEEQFSQEKKNYQIYKRKEDKLIPDNEIEHYVDVARRAEIAITKPVFVKIENLGESVNTEYEEVLPFVTGDESKLVFSSKRPSSYGVNEDNNKNGEDVYIADREGEVWVNAHKIGFEINTEMNDVVVGMNDLGNILLVNRTKKGMDYGNLYLCENKAGKWLKPVMLSESINSQHKESSACIAADGKLIYFSSNRPGGLGGKDIWKVKQLPTGEWAKPFNIGGPINTPYDEEAPFISPDGKTLYFSSNGHNTIGGYDIFSAASRGDGSWEKPENMGYPINTVDDDKYFSVGENDKTAYYSSFREDSYGGSDIYGVELLYKENFLTPVKFMVKDPQTQKPIEAMITLYIEGTDEVYGDYLPNEKGEFLFVIKPEVRFDMEISAEGFATNSSEFHINAADASDEMVFREVVLSK